MTARAARRLLGPGLGLLLCAGCWVSDPPHVFDDPPPADAGPPPRADCFEEMARSPRFVIGRCPDRAHLSLVATAPGGGRIAFEGLGHAVRIDGETIGAEQWDIIVWSPRDDGLTVSYSVQTHAPDVRVDLDFDGPCIAGRTSLSFGRSPSLDAVDVLRPTPDARADGTPRWSASPQGIEPAASADDPTPGPRLLARLGVGLALGGASPDATLETTLTPQPTDDTPPDGMRSEAILPTITLPGPLAVGDDTWLTIPWTVCIEGSGAAALDALSDRLADHTGAEARTTSPRLTARHPVDPEQPQALVDAADHTRRADRFGHLWLSGDWAADRTWWIPHEPVATLPTATAPASVGLIWPALSLPSGSPLLFQHPEWLDADCGMHCPRLDPRIPAVREHLARIRLDLDAAGFEVRLGGIDHLAPADQRGLLSALTLGDAGTPTIEAPQDSARPPVELGLSPAITLPPATPAVVARQLAFVGGLHPFARIDAEVLLAAEPQPAAIRQAMALALVTRHGALPPLDGPALDGAIGRVLAFWQQARTAAAARPLPGSWFTGADTPPPAPLDWRADDRLILFNWSEAPRAVDDPLALAPNLAGAARLLQPDQPPLGAQDRIVIPPGDAVVWATVDGEPPGE